MSKTCLSPEQLRDYPNVVLGVYSSTTDAVDSADFTALEIAHADNGMIAHLERAGQHSASIGQSVVAENPYSTRLRPNARIAELLAMRGVACIVESVLFYAIDATVKTPAELQSDAVTTFQDATVASDMITSQAEAMDANYASRFRNTIVGNWQPNFFRPQLRINGQNIFANLSASELDGDDDTKNHRGDLSMGLPLPFSLDLAREYPEGISSISVNAQVAQYIPQTASARKFVRYPVVCILQIRHK